MVKFTNQQRLEIIKNYFRNSESVVATLRALTPIFGRNNRPTRQAVHAIVDKFETKFTRFDDPVPKRRRIAWSEEIIAAVSASIQKEPNQSIPRRSQELGIAQTTLWRIMREYLGLHAFKIKLTQELKPLDHLSDEAHFWLNGFVNKQNLRYWSAKNLNVLFDTVASAKSDCLVRFSCRRCDWAVFFRGLKRPSCYRQWRALSCYVGRLFVARIGWTWHQRYVVSTRRCY